MAIPSFVDRVKLTVQAGNGGHGCTSIHREKFKPLGGPDGGNGGDGGSVILRVDDSLSTLVEYHRQSVRKATNGQPGKGDHQHGARGEAVVLPVPSGTVVTDAETGETLADLTGFADAAAMIAASRASEPRQFKSRSLSAQKALLWEGDGAYETALDATPRPDSETTDRNRLDMSVTPWVLQRVGASARA